MMVELCAGTIKYRELIRIVQRDGFMVTFVIQLAQELEIVEDPPALSILLKLSWSAVEVVKISSCWARQYETRMTTNKRNNHRLIFENTLDNSWIFLSTDGAVARDSRYAATGGVARDHERNWIVGFSRFLGVCSPFKVEVWGILDGILILFNMGLRKISILSDKQIKETITVARDSRYAATGGVARDHERNWIVGFSRFLGVCSPFKVEVWGILDGILILFNMGLRKISILSDNLEVAQVLSQLALEESGIIVLRRTQRIMRAEGQ
ncbi:hypothetical protein CXB51_012747 [Gossypium anomalum]|uniref:RNase H type-1 domain-containing protein n=1 Tax=Gossypium anomalum TaxID=47600 RepID=A0A8J5Z5Q2_9ROSI|nr:hypothetical protein CXB51_012747 [Gossypium anomalum]